MTNDNAMAWTGSPHPLPTGGQLGSGWWRAVQYTDGRRGRQISRDGETWEAVVMSEPKPDATGRRHELKTWGSLFDDILAGRKTFEVRFNDRDYRVGDILSLMRYDPATESLTYVNAGSAFRIEKRVSYVLHGGQFGIKSGFVVMGLQNVN